MGNYVAQPVLNETGIKVLPFTEGLETHPSGIVIYIVFIIVLWVLFFIIEKYSILNVVILLAITAIMLYDGYMTTINVVSTYEVELTYLNSLTLGSETLLVFLAAITAAAIGLSGSYPKSVRKTIFTNIAVSAVCLIVAIMSWTPERGSGISVRNIADIKTCIRLLGLTFVIYSFLSLDTSVINKEDDVKEKHRPEIIL
jgi:4-hydroxybenzoate polyprenyltransferase